MSALTGQQFLDLLDDMLVRANLTGAAAAYYSFIPTPGQNEFIYNSLYKTGEMFLQRVSGVSVTDVGSGYSIGENVSVTFQSLDAGTGASGTGILVTDTYLHTMLKRGLLRAYTFDPSGTNLINNGNFTNEATGWYSPTFYQYVNLSPGEFQFVNDKLYVDLFIQMLPNSGKLVITPTESGYYWGSFDVLSSSSYYRQFLFDVVSGSGTYTLPTISYLTNLTGTIYFGGTFASGASFIPQFEFYAVNGFTEPLLIDNLTFYTGNSIVSDQIFNNSAERFKFTPDAQGFYNYIVTGKNQAGIGQTYASENFYNLTSITNPTTKATLTNKLAAYSLSFWHNYQSYSGFESDNIILADWNNFQLQIRDGKYGLYCNYSHEYIPSTINASGWHNFIINVLPMRIDNIS